jgi:dCMP deaminase
MKELYMENKILIAFVPVIHKGYLDFFKKYPDQLFILGEELIEDYTPLTRDLRTVSSLEIKTVIESLKIFKSVEVLDKEKITSFLGKGFCFIMPDEDISHSLAEKYFKKENVVFEKVFFEVGEPSSN